MTPADVYPDLRLPADATWKDAAEALALWLHHARRGHACPPPAGWRWRNAYLLTEWGPVQTDRCLDEDQTDTGCAVEMVDGRWRWRAWHGWAVTMSGVTATSYVVGAGVRDLERRAATWADPRDAVADAERWLDEHHPEWRQGLRP